MNNDPPDTKIDPNYELSVFTTELLKICRQGANIWLGHKFNIKGVCERCGRHDRTLWCNAHQRRATHRQYGKPCCDPKLGGIMMPCEVVDLTGIAEIIE